MDANRLLKFFSVLSIPFFALHIFERFCGAKKNICKEDQQFTILHRGNPYNSELMQFVWFCLTLPEYRSVFYRRVGLLGRIMSIYCWPQKCLYIRTLGSCIGGGLVINHGHSTEINAKKIGKNCRVFQNVTIGTNGSSIGPTIGDNCFFGTGCVVLGEISIGNNVKIGANAIVVKDIPDNCTVVTRGTYIVKKNNEKCLIEI